MVAGAGCAPRWSGMGELEEVVAEAVFGRRLRWHWAVFWQAVLVWWYWQHMVVGLNPRGGVNVLQFWFNAVSWSKMQFIPCDVCGLPSPHLYCPCGDRMYCDPWCQQADWTDHRNYCAFGEARKSLVRQVGEENADHCLSYLRRIRRPQ